jgi:pimeloyl-ACP methyl ester carboxylesterase
LATGIPYTSRRRSRIARTRRAEGRRQKELASAAEDTIDGILAARVPVDQHTIEVAGAPVFYRSAPSAADTPAVYLHGVPTSSDDWVALLERTGGIAPDLIGFGRSGKAGNLDYTLAGLAEFLERLLGAVDVPRARVVAHDWGAAAALVLAQRHPERFERLVLCDPLPLTGDFRWHRVGRLLRTPGIGELFMGSVPRWLLARTLRRASSAEAFSDEHVRSLWEQFDQGTQRAVLRLHRSTTEEALAAAGARLGELAMPALVIWGEDDRWFPASFADYYGERLPGATVDRVAGAGHWPWLERPDVADRIAAFVSG